MVERRTYFHPFQNRNPPQSHLNPFKLQISTADALGPVLLSRRPSPSLCLCLCPCWISWRSPQAWGRNPQGWLEDVKFGLGIWRLVEERIWLIQFGPWVDSMNLDVHLARICRLRPYTLGDLTPYINLALGIADGSGCGLGIAMQMRHSVKAAIEGMCVTHTHTHRALCVKRLGRLLCEVDLSLATWNSQAWFPAKTN